MTVGFTVRSRRVLAVAAAMVGAVLVVTLGTSARAATGTRVVPPHGKVAGEGYAFWLRHSWQHNFSHTPPYSPCQTVAVNGQKVAFLDLSSLTPGSATYRCSEPAGRPVYVIELSGECSTFHGDHPNFGTSASQLKRCARAQFKGARETTTVDREAVDVSKLVAATSVYPVHNPRRNFLATKRRGGRAASYGWGLLLPGLSRGDHVIHTLASIGTSEWDITWTVSIY
jgi:hypothetical protein